MSMETGRKENTAEITSIAAAAEKMLPGLGSKTLLFRMKEMARHILRGDPIEKKDPLFWPAGLLLLGLAEKGQKAAVESWFDRWERNGSPLFHPDDALAGYAFCRLYEAGGDRRYLEGAGRIATYLMQSPKDAEESIIYNPARGNQYIYADGAGMTSMLLSHYGKLKEDGDCIRLARRQLQNFLDHALDPDQGLIYHAYDAAAGRCMGDIGWGRALGWLLMGMGVYTGDFPEDQEMREAFSKLIGSTLSWQQESGGLPWKLSEGVTTTDTSATSMVGWSILTSGVDLTQDMSGLTDSSGETGRTLADLLSGMENFVLGETSAYGKIGGALAECLDFSNYRMEFGSYPWGQGAGLAFLAAIHE